MMRDDPDSVAGRVAELVGNQAAQVRLLGDRLTKAQQDQGAMIATLTDAVAHLSRKVDRLRLAVAALREETSEASNER